MADLLLVNKQSIFLNVFTQTQMNPPKNPTSKEFMGKYYQTVKELIFQSDANGVRAKKKRGNASPHREKRS